MSQRADDGPTERGPATWLVVVAVFAIPAALGYLAGHLLMERWVKPGCEQRCAARGSTLRSVEVGHKSGTPPAGCFCQDRATVRWEGPRSAGDLQMAVYLGTYMLLLGVPAARATIERRAAGRRGPRRRG